MAPPREIGILIGDNIFTGWKKVSVSRSMEALAGSFSLSLTQSTAEIVNQIRPGCPVAVWITDGVRDAQLLSGFIDNRNTKDGPEGVEITINGRDKTADLVDCSAIVESSTWTSATLKKICDDLLKPFGLLCIDYAENLEPLEKFTIQNGDTVHAVIESTCRSRGVLPLTDRWGNLTLVNSTGQTASIERIERGYNLLSMEEKHDETNRFSKYIIKGTANTGGDGHGWDEVTTSMKSEATDTQITRYRPVIINAEGKPTNTSIKKRALWEAQVRAGRSKEYSATVRGWIQGDESSTSEYQPWDINHLVPVRDSIMGINQDMLITGVEFSSDDSGELTTVTLKHPDTYKADPSGGIDV